ncbi:MAG: hypothetical protein Q9210_006194 [Variospora velana]
MPQDFLQDAQLAGHIQKLPKELQNQIEETIYKLVFFPGLLHPPISALYDANAQKHHTNTDLLTVDKHVCSKYRERMWAENTLVIGSIKPRFLKNLVEGQPAACRSIRKVYLSFSTEDLGYGPDAQPQDPRVPADHPQQSELFYLALTRRWLVKAFYINQLCPWLEELTLDVTDADAPNGRWKAQHFVYFYLLGYLRSSFGKIPNLKIRARDKHQEGQILVNMRRLNDWVLSFPRGLWQEWTPQEWQLQDEPVLPPIPLDY